MKHFINLFVLILVLAIGVSTFAHDKHQHKTAAKPAKGKVEFLGKGDGVTTCPVTGETIESKANKAVLYGRAVYFCCPDCMAEAKKNPAAYVKRTHKEQLAAIKNAPKAEEHTAEHHAEHHGDHHAAAQEASKDAPKAEEKFLGKGDGIETCPVTGEPVNKSLKGEVNGQTFYVCCEGCIETVKKNPDTYLKKASK